MARDNRRLALLYHENDKSGGKSGLFEKIAWNLLVKPSRLVINM